MVILVLLLASCAYDRQSRSIRKETEKDWTAGLRFIAEGGDGSRGYYFMFGVDGHFSISEYIRVHALCCNNRYYAGQYEARHDTILLTSFYKDVRPSGMEDYLIKDTSRSMVFYPYKDNKVVVPLIPKKLRPDNRGLMRTF